MAGDDYLDPVELQVLADAAADLGADAEVGARSLTWHHLTSPVLKTGALNPAAGVLVKAGTTSAVSALRGHARDAFTNNIIAGRYKYLIAAAEFAGSVPGPEDRIVDDGDTLAVRAVRRDGTGTVWLAEAVLVTEA